MGKNVKIWEKRIKLQNMDKICENWQNMGKNMGKTKKKPKYGQNDKIWELPYFMGNMGKNFAFFALKTSQNIVLRCFYAKTSHIKNMGSHINCDPTHDR